MRILMVRLREIGDVVFTTPAVHALRTRFPHAHLTYVVEPHAAPVLRRHPDIDELILAPRARGAAGFARDVALGLSLRRKRFELAIDFHGGPRASLLTWLSRAPERIGYEIAGRAWMYTRRVGRPRALRPRHSVENQWDLLRPLGIEPPDRERDAVTMAVDPDAVATVAARLSAAGVEPADRMVVVHVSAGNPFRRWPIEHFAALISGLARSPDRRIVVTSGPSERGAAARVVAAARASLDERSAARVLAIGDFSLAELRVLLDRAALFVGGDSGPLHIAATTGVPIVGLYGPTLPERSAPWRSPALRTISIEPEPLPCRPCDQRVCAPGDFRCLTGIRPERVADAAIRCLT
jgi:lipopolysaccharide heptosyltransferase II